MFQAAQLLHAYRIRFPRVRGDVPGVLRRNRHHQLFSPRARGCSPLRMASHQLHLVFPACAGMFLGTEKFCHFLRSFPRVRGDVPRSAWRRTSCTLFSPRARGCSSGSQKFSARKICFPRVRGDVPRRGPLGGGLFRFSPRARGCSQPWQGGDNENPVFPACAGMFPSLLSSDLRSSRFPRVRGDVPPTVKS